MGESINEEEKKSFEALCDRVATLEDAVLRVYGLEKEVVRIIILC
jgi:hypothetical protein